jgi:hypothetical protein
MGFDHLDIARPRLTPEKYTIDDSPLWPESTSVFSDSTDPPCLGLDLYSVSNLEQAPFRH